MKSVGKAGTAANWFLLDRGGSRLCGYPTTSRSFSLVALAKLITVFSLKNARKLAQTRTRSFLLSLKCKSNDLCVSARTWPAKLREERSTNECLGNLPFAQKEFVALPNLNERAAQSSDLRATNEF